MEMAVAGSSLRSVTYPALARFTVPSTNSLPLRRPSVRLDNCWSPPGQNAPDAPLWLPYLSGHCESQALQLGRTSSRSSPCAACIVPFDTVRASPHREAFPVSSRSTPPSTVSKRVRCLQQSCLPFEFWVNRVNDNSSYIPPVNN